MKNSYSYTISDKEYVNLFYIFHKNQHRKYSKRRLYH